MATAANPRRDWPGIAGCAVVGLIGIAALANSGDFSPLGSVFPRTIAGLMIVLALIYVVLAWRRARVPVAAAPVDARASTARRAGVAIVMLAWAFLLAPLGFLFTSCIASLSLLLLAQHDRWTPRALLACGAATVLVLIALYALFRFVLKVPLPVGMFW